MLTIHPPSFIETEDCDGPRYVRGQPSRETPGVLMTEMQNKYITEFELPYRNIERYIKEIGNNWNRLDDKQRSLVKTSFQNMGLVGKMSGMESFGNTGSLVCTCGKGAHNCVCKEKFGDPTDTPTATPTALPTSTPTSTPGPVDPNVANFIKYLSTDHANNTKKFMDTLWNTTPEQTLQLGLTGTQLSDVRDSMYQWSVDNTYVLHSNWRSGVLLFFFIFIIIILIIVAATGNNGNGNAFGKSLFGRRF
jgi:hypothetical protein